MKPSFNPSSPPAWATRLLRWYCSPHKLEEIEGDLEEEFMYQVSRVGVRRARRDYIRHVLGFMRPFAIKQKPTTPSALKARWVSLKGILPLRHRHWVCRASPW